MLGNSLEEQLIAINFCYSQQLRWAPRLSWGFWVGSAVCFHSAPFSSLCPHNKLRSWQILSNMLLVLDAHHPYLFSSHPCFSCQSSPASFAFIWSWAGAFCLPLQDCLNLLSNPRPSSSFFFPFTQLVLVHTLEYLDIIYYQ